VGAWVVYGVVIINKGLTAYAAVLVGQIGTGIAGQGVGRAAAVLFLWNPASVFYHSVYSEPLFAVLTLQAIKYALENESKSNTLI
jgi:hypothetical protein